MSEPATTSGQAEPAPLLDEPRPIRQLSESVVNRIAAGEVVQRPANAVKELLENALDAGATTVRVEVKDGGLKRIVIVDDGLGIRHEDLPLLCQRFATSKISTFDDLSSLSSYGFRGEALASISHVAHLTVVTKTRHDLAGWKAKYADGILVPHSSSDTSSEPKRAAAVNGTQFIIEDLFYNIPTRLRALKSASDEYARILDVLGKYAIQNASVSISCRKVGAREWDLNTGLPASVSILSDATSSQTQQDLSQQSDVIGGIYGQAIKKELVEVSLQEDTLALSAHGWFSGLNFSAKKAVYVIFVNNRLVESRSIRKSLEIFYAPLLPKGGFPFVYISLMLDPATIDVNVHPTKSEVGFMNEDDISDALCTALEAKLEESRQSRGFKVISAPRNSANTDPTQQDARLLSRNVPQHQIRTDHQARTLTSMLVTDGQALERSQLPTQAPIEARKGKITESACNLTSIQELRAEVGDSKHAGASAIFADHTFVGVVDSDRGLSLIQHATKLYIARHDECLEELFYQLGLRQFGQMGRMLLDPPPKLSELIQIAVDHEPQVTNAHLSPDEIKERATRRWLERRDMVAEYFAIDLDELDRVVSVPLILPGYTPPLENLPRFFLHGAVQIEWTSERGCFASMLRSIARMSLPLPPELETMPTGVSLPPETAYRWQIEHVLFPALKAYLVAPVSLRDQGIIHVASLSNLYKVFERC
ncbi:hypothetical protein E5Q_05664 [Mixia osmundae IAM 14324]|uniref:DNA mismatch repair protein S5 domain-containing protein n=1 Tax=Mixia osmundae (strain CBS 9802 / IAM 14324 / JCM 22182 / KY 12970) TaxID=764103 RepID=G7E816_MIXOS|nr:hypothetical protein E5Q_05664 [Mixia osmundae IAM 14324]